MFQLTTVNELSCKAVCTDGRGALYTKAGAMIGYQGQCKFEKVLLGPEGNVAGALLGHIGRRLTGENMPLMKVISSVGSTSFYANLAQHVTIIDLYPNETLKVESENLLAFTDTCRYGFKFLAQGILSQKGLFTSELSALQQGAKVAILSEGNPLVLETPCCVDPDAIVAWTGADPELKLDLSWKNLIGQASGESYMFDFKRAGYQVVVQPSERKSGIDIGIDGRGGRPDIQQNQTLQGAAGNIGDTLNSAGNILGQFSRMTLRR